MTTQQTNSLPGNITFPVLKNFYDVIIHREALIRAVNDQPMMDFVYHFPHLFTNTFRTTSDRIITPEADALLNEKFNWCIAGSAALHHIHSHLRQAFNNLKEMEKTREENLVKLINTLKLNRGSLTIEQFIEFIKNNKEFISQRLSSESLMELDTIINSYCNEKLPDTFSDISLNTSYNDVDIFFLNSPVSCRMQIGHTDIVHSTCKTVDELLLNFDLPCCRVSMNSKHDYYISAQCLYALLTNEYPLPNYVQDRDSFISLLKNHRNGDPMRVSEEFLYQRILERIKKYKQRGFNVVWYKTDYVLPWIQNRFHYGEWKQITP